jgi:hypothetical protein
MPDTTDTARAAMEAILRREYIGHLALRDGADLYVLPINYTYAGGRILFHCALTGRKLDCIRAHPRVCFEVSRQEAEPAPHAGTTCSAGYESVICWGRARVIEDAAERVAVLGAFQARYDDPAGRPRAITDADAARCGAVEIVVERMTGRRKTAAGSEEWAWEA